MTSKEKTKKIVLFDAHAIIHRAYHALPDFSSSSGEPTGGLYGIVAMLLRIIDDIKPDYMVACYDLPDPTFRSQVYKEYKAGRAKADDSLIAQMSRSRDIFTSFGIPIYDAPGFEADDVIGTITNKTKKIKNLQTIIASGDMDTLQLVDDDKVVVYTLKRGLNDTILYNEERVVERFGFDPEYLVDFKGLRGDPSDNIIGIKGIGEKTATTLIQNFGSLENIYKKLSKQEEEFLKVGIKPRIINLLKEGEEEALFSKTLATIRLDAPISFSLPDMVWQEELDFTKVEALFSELEFKNLLARARNILLKETESTIPKKEEEVNEEELTKAKICLWLLDSNKTNPDLTDIKNYTGQDNFKEAFKSLKKEIKEKKLLDVYEEIELPLIPILKKATQRGIAIDVSHFEKMSKEVHKELKKISEKIYKLAGREFNINSPKQLGEVLFDELQISTKGLKKTAGGARSTRESELEKIKDVHPIIELILQQRGLSKLTSTYIDVIPKLVDDYGRLHSTLHQTGTTTGRMSSSDPNLQNIPADLEYGKKIRQGFVATPGHKFIAVDYSQIELRILAILSGDPNLKNIFIKKADVHSSVASQVFGVKEKDVTKDMRRQAKVINFGIIYGMGVNALRNNLNSTREEAQRFYDNYFATFPTIKDYFNKVIEETYAKGYTETIFGRRRYFPGIRSKLPFMRAQAERGAMNAPIQGTEADLVKIASIKIEEELKRLQLINQCHFVLQIHDELIYEVEEKKVDKAIEIIVKEMEKVLKVDIPMEVEVEIGDNLGDLQEFNK